MDTNTKLIETMYAVGRLMKEDMSYASPLMRLSMLQIQALVFVKKNNGAQMSDIATFFSIELPSATSLITTLKKAKLVERKPDKNDRRLVRIYITIKGESLLKDAMSARSKKINQNLKFLSAEDKKTLLTIMEKLLGQLTKQNEK